MTLSVPFRFENSSLAWCAPDIVTKDECEHWIRFIEHANPSLATNNAAYRDQDRVIHQDEMLAATLLSRLRAHLPAMMGSLTLSGLNSRFRMYRYRPGQRFLPHMDHWYLPDNSHISLHSVLIYLNADFEGGETRFMEQLENTVKPERGMAAIFQHKLRHEGCPVVQGTKYAIRTDVIYASPEPIAEVGGVPAHIGATDGKS